MDAATIQKITIWILPVLLAVSLHEAAHAWMANKKGDSTAKSLGRLTFNPFKHIDPIGTIIVPAVMGFTTGFIFGWAKPVPIDIRNLNNPKKDMMWVALAGPVSNFIMAILWSIFLYFSVLFSVANSSVSLFLILMAIAGININILLGIINLLPIPPLDGGRVMAGLLPTRLAIKYNKIEPYGFFVLVGLMFTGALSSIFFLTESIVKILVTISGLNT
ncbi:MAG: site-2 protease family protein [gamma proteobacterium symbiont of Taylorina sp.]|nr:site-2 protease family protein [gamma proteobacterium symbiont of Taylorina sp.]